MSGKVTVEIDVKDEAFVRRVLALREEMEQLALTAAEGTVFHVCEQAVIDKGRQLQSQMLGEAVAQRIAAAEKKGLPCGGVRVNARKKTKAPKSDS